MERKKISYPYERQVHSAPVTPNSRVFDRLTYPLTKERHTLEE